MAESIQDYFTNGPEIKSLELYDAIGRLKAIEVTVPESWYLFIYLFSQISVKIENKYVIEFYKVGNFPIRVYLARKYPELAVSFFLEAGRPEEGILESYIQAGIHEFGSVEEQIVLKPKQDSYFKPYTPKRKGKLIRPEPTTWKHGLPFEHVNNTINSDFIEGIREEKYEILNEDIPEWIFIALKGHQGPVADELLSMSDRHEDFYKNLLEKLILKNQDMAIWTILSLPKRYMKNVAEKITDPILKKGANDRFFSWEYEPFQTKSEERLAQLVNPNRLGIVRPLPPGEEEIISAITFEPITGDYVKCMNKHPHFFEADQFAKYCKVQGLACLLCPVDTIYKMDPRLFHQKVKSNYEPAKYY